MTRTRDKAAAGGGAWTDTSPAELISAHLTRPPSTARVYRADLRTFREFLGAADDAAAVRFFFDLSRGAAQRMLDRYTAHLRTLSGYAPLTIRRKIGSILGLARLAHRYDVTAWTLFARGLPAAIPSRDVRGPSRQDFLDMVHHAHDRGDEKGLRDVAILSCLFYCALRCAELLSLDVKHVDLDAGDAGEMRILAKGLRGARWPVPIIPEVGRALRHWTHARGDAGGPLCVSLNRAERSVAEPRRLSYSGLYSVVRETARQAGVKKPVHPHALRHAAATELCRITNGNVAFGMALTRHRDPKTYMIYRDAARSDARQAMAILAAGHAAFDAEGGLS